MVWIPFIRLVFDAVTRMDASLLLIPKSISLGLAGLCAGCVVVRHRAVLAPAPDRNLGPQLIHCGKAVSAHPVLDYYGALSSIRYAVSGKARRFVKRCALSAPSS